MFQLEKGATNTSKTDGDRSAELRRLQFYGAGPKMAGYNRHSDKFKKKHYEIDPVRIFEPLRFSFFWNSHISRTQNFMFFKYFIFRD